MVTQERRIYSALALLFLALLVAMGTAFFKSRDLAEKSGWVNHTHAVRQQIGQLLQTQLEVQIAARGYVITDDFTYLQPYRAAVASNEMAYRDLAMLVQDNSGQLARVNAFDTIRQQHLSYADRLVSTRQQQGIDAAQELLLNGDDRRLMNEVRSAIGDMDALEVGLLASRANEEVVALDELTKTLIATALFAVLVMIVGGAAIHRDFRLQAAAEQRIRQQNEELETRVQERTRALGESEQQQRLLVGAIQDYAIIRLDPQGSILSWNDAAKRMKGYETDEVIGKSLAIFHLPEDVASGKLQRLLAIAAKEGRCVDEGWRVRKDGSRFYADTILAPLRDDSGTLIGFAKITRDITQRKQAEVRINLQLEHLKLLDQITRAIGERLDLNSIFQVVTRTLEDSLVLQFVSICLYDAVNDELHLACLGEKTLPQLAQCGLVVDGVIPIDQNGLSRCIAGELVYEPDITDIQFPFPQRLSGCGLRSLVLAPLRAESRVFGVLIAARNTTEGFTSTECEFMRQLSEHVALASHQAQLHTELQAAYDNLNKSQQTAIQHERLRALGQMASGIAHDINNALSPVSLYTDMLMEKEAGLSERGIGFMKVIQLAVEDVAETVARMREFYRPHEEAEFVPVDVNSQVQQVLELTRVRWHDMKQVDGIVIDTRTELGEQLPKILGSESEIRDALTNLVFNAIDAMPDGGTLTLRTKLIKEGNVPVAVAIEVADTGIGMTEETRQRCLEPFYTTKGERGTGLGLAMVFGMVQRHAGLIDVESKPGRGALFRLVFSRLASQPALSADDKAQVRPQRLRLLLVDDDPVLLKSLSNTLEADGHDITVASGGETGIVAFRTELDKGKGFSAVITDLGMPYVDGKKLAAAIKSLSPTTPVIMLTGWGRRLFADGDIPPHVDQVLAKPPKLRELRAALVKWC